MINTQNMMALAVASSTPPPGLSEAFKAAIAAFEEKHHVNRNEPVEFRLISPTKHVMMHQVGIATGTVGKMIRNSHYLPLVEDVIDPESGRFHRLAYYEGGWAPNKQPSYIKFKSNMENCVIRVIPNLDPDLYDRLILSDLNTKSANPKRRPDIGNRFTIVVPTQEELEAYEQDKLVDDARTLINQSKDGEVLRVARRYNFTDTDHIKARRYLRGLSDGQAKQLIEHFASDESQIVKMVETLTEMGSLVLNRAAGIGGIGEYKFNGQVVMQTDPARAAVDQLVDFLQLPGGEIFRNAMAAVAAMAPKPAPVDPGAGNPPAGGNGQQNPPAGTGGGRGRGQGQGKGKENDNGGDTGSGNGENGGANPPTS